MPFTAGVKFVRASVYWDLYIQIFICNMLLMWLITWLFFPSGRCFQVWRQTYDSGVTGRNTIPKGTRVTYYLKTSIMTFWNETYLKCYIVLPTMKTCLIVTILCLQWGTYVIYLSKVFAHQKLFLLYAQPQKFHPASNHCLTAIIGMSLKYSRLKRFCQNQKKGRQTIWLWSNMIWEHFCTGEEGYLHHTEMETGDRVKNRKRQKKPVPTAGNTSACSPS